MREEEKNCSPKNFQPKKCQKIRDYVIRIAFVSFSLIPTLSLKPITYAVHMH
jgi:hypothetical protein